MGEFKLQHLISELLKNLGGRNSPDNIVQNLQKIINTNSNNGNQNTSQVALQCYIQSLLKDHPNADIFLTKYDDIKQKNVDSLNSYIQLLHHIMQDSTIREFLLKTVQKSPSQTCSTEPKLTPENLQQVRSNLKKAVTKQSTTKQHDKISNISIISSLPSGTTPSIVSWVQRRPNMSWDFSTHNLTTPVPSNIPITSQESILIDDLLNVLIGLPGCLIEPEQLHDHTAPRSFRIHPSVSPTLQGLVKDILPVASHYSVIQRFTEEKIRFEYGQVNNALAEEMRAILKEHMLFTVQLEGEFRNGNLNLQKLFYFVQKNLQHLSVTANIASTISKSNAKGGTVLSLLHDQIISSIGNEKTQQLCVQLMESACVPYMKMLSMWIYRGIIQDPINEFLVEDKEMIQKEEMPVDYSADYWDKKYAIRRECIPKFLKPVSDIILKTGKYLNVIRQCGKSLKTNVLPIQYKTEEKHYIESIEKAYKFASQTLLNLIIKEMDLLNRLKSVKHYFLLDKGDFIMTFLTLCEKEFTKNVNDIVQARLESKLDLALRLSSANEDLYKDDLKTQLLPYDLQFQMNRIVSIQTNNEREYWVPSTEQKPLSAIESFSFTYEVHWPLSLILNVKSLARYQMIFRHLFYCKHVEKMICQVWRSNKVVKKFNKSDAQHYRSAFSLRQRMLHCVQNLEYHMMVEVIEPHWCTFLQKFHKVNNVDELLQCHNDFLNSCLNDCMLKLPWILATITKLLTICVEFCGFMQRMQRFFVEAELGSLPNSFYESFTQAEFNVPNAGDTMMTSSTTIELEPSFTEKIAKFDEEFTTTVMKLLVQIDERIRRAEEQERLLNLLYRLDFNSFYASQIEKLPMDHVKDSSG